jgi:membrane protease YdiL (CAAX protease family)
MTESITATFNEFISFIKNPEDRPIHHHATRKKLTTVLSLFLIQLPILMILGMLFSLIEELGLIDQDAHIMEEMMKSFSTIQIVLLVAIVGPILEEIIFRMMIRFRRNYIILWTIKLLAMLGVQTKYALLRNFRMRWDQYFTVVFYCSVMIFGLVHITNFKGSINVYLLAPILVSPQLIMGMVLGYVRLKYGLIWSIYFHSFHNTILLTMGLLSGEI